MDVDTTNFIARWVRMALKIHGGESNKVCLVQKHPKISSKAIYGNSCGVNTMETILLETFIKHIADLYEVRKDA